MSVCRPAECGPLLLLNIFHGVPGGLANTKDITYA